MQLLNRIKRIEKDLDLKNSAFCQCLGFHDLELRNYDEYPEKEIVVIYHDNCLTCGKPFEKTRLEKCRMDRQRQITEIYGKAAQF